MSTEKQKRAAPRGRKRTRRVERRRFLDESHPHGLSTAEKKRLPADAFAFPSERKEPLVDASHVRNAVVRFGQVEDVSDHERARAWQRIQAAAKRFGVHIHAHN